MSDPIKDNFHAIARSLARLTAMLAEVDEGQAAGEIVQDLAAAAKRPAGPARRARLREIAARAAALHDSVVPATPAGEDPDAWITPSEWASLLRVNRIISEWSSKQRLETSEG